MYSVPFTRIGSFSRVSRAPCIVLNPTSFGLKRFFSSELRKTQTNKLERLSYVKGPTDIPLIEVTIGKYFEEQVKKNPSVKQTFFFIFFF